MKSRFLDLSKQYIVDTYDPLPIVISKVDGCYYIDTEGRRFLNFTSAYSAQNWGIINSRFVGALVDQAFRLPLTSRAIQNDILPVFAREICNLFGYEKLIPMNSGAEAVETAIKVVRRWGQLVKGVPEDLGEIIVFNRNFAGRTITIISFSSQDKTSEMKRGFGPFTPGFKICEFNNLNEFKRLVSSNTIAVLLEPIQGEGGINLIDPDFFKKLYEISRMKNFLIIADEIQCGLFRAGRLTCSERFGVKPDLLVLGKSLGGGLVPISVVLGNNHIFSCMTIGSHGSTFGGNPLAARVGLEVIRYIKENKEALETDVDRKGEIIRNFLKNLRSEKIREIRGMGLMIGMELNFNPSDFVKLCAQKGLIVGKARGNVVRLTPPLIIPENDIDFALETIREALQSLS